MILRDAMTVFHKSPLRPGFNDIAAWIPDSLTPDHVFEIQRGAVMHHPFGYGFSFRRFYL